LFAIIEDDKTDKGNAKKIAVKTFSRIQREDKERREGHTYILLAEQVNMFRRRNMRINIRYGHNTFATFYYKTNKLNSRTIDNWKQSSYNLVEARKAENAFVDEIYQAS